MGDKFKNDLNEEALKYCAGMAFRDLCRKLRFSENASDNDKENFRVSMYGLIIKWINADILTITDPESQFDDKHKDVCERIREKAKKATCSVRISLLGKNKNGLI